jgi:hypothetical protein
MKTLEEVKAHVDKVGYNQLAIQKIEGFLLGNGLLGEEFEMEYMIGERTFDDFRTWFNGEEHQETPIDWSEFGFGDFIHVQKGIDVVLLGGIYDGNVVCYNGECIVKLILTSQSRPCNEHEIESLVRMMNRNGIDYCFVKNEFIYKGACCCDCDECKFTEKENQPIEELNKNYEELCRIADSMSEDNPFKSVAKSIVEGLGKMMDEVKEAEKDDSASIDMLEIDAKDAIENIIANIHACTMDENERKNVILALQGLVTLGKLYE